MPFDSRFGNFTIPDGLNSVNPNPRAIAHANVGAMRVTVHNIGPVTLFLAYDPAELIDSSGPTDGTFVLVTGAREDFNLAAEQKIFAIGGGANSRVTVSMSDATLN